MKFTVNLMEVYSTPTSHSNLIIAQFILFPFMLHIYILSPNAGKNEAILGQCIQQLGEYWSKSVLVNPVKFVAYLKVDLYSLKHKNEKKKKSKQKGQ